MLRKKVRSINGDGGANCTAQVISQFDHSRVARPTTAEVHIQSIVIIDKHTRIEQPLNI